MFCAEMCKVAPIGAALLVGSGAAEAAPVGAGVPDYAGALADGPMLIGDDAGA